MKKYIVLLTILITLIFSAHARSNKMNSIPKVQVTQELINALVKVESRGDSTKVGKHGELGILQIRQCVIDDVNNLIDKKKNKWNLKDSLDNDKAKIICQKYLEYWGSHYQKQTGHKVTNEVLSKIWNGGPNFYKKVNKVFLANIEHYWNKVQIALA